MQTSSNIWWIGPLVLVFIRVVISNARLSKAERDGNALVFRVAPMFRYTASLGLLLLALLTIRAVGKEETWVVVAGFTTVLLIALVWPPTFVCTPTALIRSFWWRPKTALPWNEVAQIERTKGGDLNIYDIRGSYLSFTRFHVDVFRFESEVLRRSNIKPSVESSEPVSIR